MSQKQIRISFTGGTLDESVYRDLENNYDVSFGNAFDVLKKTLETGYRIVESRPVNALTKADSVIGIGRKASNYVVNYTQGKKEQTYENPSDANLKYLIDDPDKKGIEITEVKVKLNRK